MSKPDSPHSSDFTAPFTEAAPRLVTDDLHVKGIEIPPERAAPTPDFVPEAAAPPTFAMLPPRPKKRKTWLILPLFAIGGGLYFGFQPSRTTLRVTPRTAAQSVPREVPKRALSRADRNRIGALWKRGAAAKKRGDFAAARAAWQEGLKLDPRNAGFSESLAKLRRAAAKSRNKTVASPSTSVTFRRQRESPGSGDNSSGD